MGKQMKHNWVHPVFDKLGTGALMSRKKSSRIEILFNSPSSAIFQLSRDEGMSNLYIEFFWMIFDFGLMYHFSSTVGKMGMGIDGQGH